MWTWVSIFESNVNFDELIKISVIRWGWGCGETMRFQKKLYKPDHPTGQPACRNTNISRSLPIPVLVCIKTRLLGLWKDLTGVGTVTDSRIFEL